MSSKAIRKSGSLSFPIQTQDPFLFGVYHKDNYPAGNASMEAPIKGNGADFGNKRGWSMYHGNKIPGFPSHPHRGLETITCTIEGVIDHADSLGVGGRYGNGDLQYMTSGKGIQHSEMFPLLNESGNNMLRFYQLWLNLPKKHKMVPPSQKLHWAEDIPKYQSEDGKSTLTIWTGEYKDLKGLDPTEYSWAADRENDVNIWFITMKPGGILELPAPKENSNRTLYFMEGRKLKINGQELDKQSYAELKEMPVTLENFGDDSHEILILQGRPLNEKVVQHGPFVMNSQEEIQQAFMDYRKTQFGGWPWDRSDPVHSKEEGRFLKYPGKKATYPPNKA